MFIVNSISTWWTFRKTKKNKAGSPKEFKDEGVIARPYGFFSLQTPDKTRNYRTNKRRGGSGEKYWE
ncbi:hypothetical protein ACFLRX_00815 [Acidobacteriota bacterium]